MRDCINTTPAMEAEEQLIAAAQQIVKALEKNKNLTDDAKKILASLGSRLTSIASISDTYLSEESKDDEGLNEIDDQLNKIQDKIMNWEKEQSTMIWDFSPQEGYEYLKAVKKARKLIEILENRSPNSSEEVIWLNKAHDVLQTAMARLEDEFRHLLVHNRQPFEPEHMSFRSTDEDIVEAGSVISSGDDSIEDLVHRFSIGRNSEEYVIDLVNRDVIPDLKSIARVMFESSYGRECSQVFIDVQKDALDDCLFILEVEKLSVEDVLKMDWNTLNSKIRRWMRAMKIFVRVYLASEKLLSDQIFGEIEPTGRVCFAESSKAAILHLLNLPEAIAIGPHGPEKLIRILDMYEVLAGLIPDIAGLYNDHETGSGSCVRTECEGVLRRLADCAKSTFLEFENAVASNVSTSPFPGGGVHHVTRYVLNYMKTLVDYKKTLDEVLKDQDDEGSENSVAISPDRTSTHSEDENVDGNPFTPTARHFRSLVSILERNLDDKSKLYKDEPLQHLFLTNNVHYMTEKVKDSELRTVLGDEWIRKHNWKFQQYAMSYERATWSSILALLKDEGLQNPGSNSISRTILKERLQSFYLAFEEVYKSQTGWKVPDQRLRDDLRISTSLKVIQAYRTFVGRHINHVSEKYIKYSADDLEDFLLDLFEGSQKSLHGHKK